MEAIFLLNKGNNVLLFHKDEDCWIGELNGLRGWFPAKFVQLLDERSKQYSSAGDDSINENIAHLVRGTLAPTIKHVLEHGMKKASILGRFACCTVKSEQNILPTILSRLHQAQLVILGYSLKKLLAKKLRKTLLLFILD